MRRSNSPIDLEDIELARQIIRRDPSFHETPHHLHERSRSPSGSRGMCRGFCLATDPLTVAKEGYRRIDDRAVSGVGKCGEGTYRLDLCLWSRRVYLALGWGPPLAAPREEENAPPGTTVRCHSKALVQGVPCGPHHIGRHGTRSSCNTKRETT